jgi:linoleate 10R-lipoxygenase
VDYAVLTIAQAVRVVFGLQNIRRAAGDAGKLKKIITTKNETKSPHYIQANGAVSMWPGAMYLVVCFSFVNVR